MDTNDIKIKAVVVGVLIDLGGSIVLGIVLGVVVVATNGGATTPENLAALKDNLYVNLFGLLGALFCTVLGGYVAARMSLPEGLINSLAVGVVSLVLGIVVAVAWSGLTPDWKTFAGFILTIPAAWAGGKIATRASS